MVGCGKIRRIHWALFPAKRRAPRRAVDEIRVAEPFCAMSGVFILVDHHEGAQQALEMAPPAGKG